ncbi:hypothetical protein PHAVU_011G191532 [Phaseolus vulgaris]
MLLHHIESLSIHICPGMNILINHCYHFLVELDINECCDSLTNFPLDLFPNLCGLKLGNCGNLRMISQGHPHRHLKNLSIQHCSEFESFPNEGLFALQLESFYIKGLEKLKSMPKHISALLPSLHFLNIMDCPGVELSEGCLPSNLKHISLWNCSKLVASLKKGVWRTNPSIESLSFKEEDVECFPDEGLLPLSPTNLEIRDCPKLKKLDYKGLSPFLSSEIGYSELSNTGMLARGGSSKIHFTTHNYRLSVAQTAGQERRRRRLEKDSYMDY